MELLSLRPSLKAAVINTFWALLLLSYFMNWPIPYFRPALTGLLWLSLVLAAAAGYGQFWAQRAMPRDTTPTEFLIFSVALGYGVIGLLMMVAGIFGWWKPVTADGVVLLGLALQFYKRRPLVAIRWDETVAFVPACLLVAAAVISLLITLTPITYYDSLVYHLAMPANYVQSGRWIPLTSLIYSSFPQAVEMLWTFGLLLSNDVLVNLIGWSLAAALVFSVAAFSRRYISRDSGWYAAALLAAMPATLLLSSGGYVDIGLTLFSFLSLYAIFLWKENQNIRTLGMAGAFAGFAVATKYTGALSLALGLVLLASTVRFTSFKKLFTTGGVFCAFALIGMAPWLIKNIHYVGNPVFPFIHTWGMAQKNPWLGEAAAGYFRGLTEYRSRSLWELGRVMWNAVTHGMEFGGGMDVLGNFGWTPLFALLPGLWLVQRPKCFAWLGAYSAAFFVIWAMTRPVLRFLLPLAPVLALLAGYGWSQAKSATTPRWYSKLLSGAVGLLMLSNFSLFFTVANELSLFTVPIGLENRDTFLRRRLTYYSAAEFVNRSAEVKRVFVVGDQRGYYYQKPTLVTPVFNQNPLVKWTEEAATPDALRTRLKSQGFTHLLVNHSEMDRLAPYKIFPFSDTGGQRWNDLLQTLPLVYEDHDCKVFAL